ncbi:MAG TPA: PIG-L family deacetylase [Thermoanaerobaculia bacterium]|nr:PIG-L family deacetylase [Thermoanaerobaculia bacterium]
MRSFGCAILLGTLVFAAAVAQGQDKAAPRVPPTFPGASSVLWVGAHPDDEVLAAPLLARLCLDEGLRCSFLVLTRGEKGPCLLPGGCRPDLAAVRSAEMAGAARLFGADLILWSLPDAGSGQDGSAGTWDAASGSHAALVASVRKVLSRTRPDVVLTFDPRHGSTCHLDHRAAGSLVLEAVSRVEKRPAVYLLETRLVLTSAPVTVRFQPAALARDGVFAFDGNAPLASTARPAWEMTNRDVLIHASQFDAPLRRAIRRVPSAQRAVFLGPADLLLSAADVWTCP